VKTHGGFHECKEILLKWKPNSSPTRTPIRLGIRSLFAVVAVLCLLFALYGRLKPSGKRALPEIVITPPPIVCGYRNAKSSLLSNESNQNAGCRGYIGDSFWSTNLRFSRVQYRAFLLASLCSYLTILLV
jgi:hypothetical protein